MGGAREKVVGAPSYGAPYKDRAMAPKPSSQNPNSLANIIDRTWRSLFGKKSKEWESQIEREDRWVKKSGLPKSMMPSDWK